MWKEGSKIKQIEGFKYWQEEEEEEECEEEGNSSRQESKFWSVIKKEKGNIAVRLVSLEFFIDIKSFWLHYGPGVDSASSRNEYQEHFLGVKAASA